MATIDSYLETNVDSDNFALKALHPVAAATFSACGQAFAGPATVYTTTSLKFYAKKVGSPTGTATFELYACTGTPGTNGMPTGSVLATGNFDVSTLTTSYALYEVTFSTPYKLTASTNYVVMFTNPTSGTIDASNYPVIGTDGSSPTHGGNTTYYTSGAWTYTTGYDTAFYLYGTTEAGGAFLLFT